MDEQNFITRFASKKRSSLEEIRRQNQLFRLPGTLEQLLNAGSNALIVVNKNRQIVYISRTILETLGVKSEQDALGLHPGELLGCVNAHDSNGKCNITEICKTCGVLKAILNSLDGEKDVQECPVLLNEKEGNERTLRVWTTPLQVNDEHFSVFSFEDISHEKRRKSLEWFFFHNLLNTLSSLYSSVDLAKTANQPQRNAFLDQVSNLANALLEDINVQRTLIAAENNELSVNKSAIASLDFLSIMIELYSKRDFALNRHLEIDPHAVNLSLLNDYTLLRHVFGNMIRNALEVSEPGDYIILGCKVVQNKACFWVYNPQNIPHAAQLQDFKRSFSTNNPDQGLRTYSTRLLAERYLGGYVNFTSSVDSGTTFEIYLPME